MRWKEFGLWLGFLFVCFGAGYLHGHLPDFRLQFLFTESEKVKIVVFEKTLLSSEIIKTLEEKTHTEIQIEEVKSWQEARLKTVLNPGADLLFVPSYWLAPLIREGRLRTVTTLKNLIENEIAPELRHVNNEKIYEVPLFWTIFGFAFPEAYKEDPIDKILENPKIKTISTYHDAEIFKIRSRREPWNYPKIKAKLKPTASLKNSAKVLPADEVVEISLHQQKEMQSAFFSAIDDKKPLLVFSLAVPNNSPKRTTSLALIQALLTETDLDDVYSELPIGMGIHRLNSKLNDRLKKASYLKEIPFKEIELPEMND